MINDIIRMAIVLIVYGGLQFFLGCQYAVMNEVKALDNKSELWYDIKDPNLDHYFDRDTVYKGPK